MTDTLAALSVATKAALPLQRCVISDFEQKMATGWISDG